MIEGAPRHRRRRRDSRPTQAHWCWLCGEQFEVGDGPEIAHYTEGGCRGAQFARRRGAADVAARSERLRALLQGWCCTLLVLFAILVTLGTVWFVVVLAVTVVLKCTVGVAQLCCGASGGAASAHCVEIKRRVDGVGRPNFDFHTGRASRGSYSRSRSAPTYCCALSASCP